METAAATENSPRLPFEDIYVKHRKYVYLVCYRVLRNQDDAEETTQETFLKAWRSLPTFTGGCKLSTWLYRIAMNSALERKRRSHPEVISLDQPELDEEGGVHFQEIPAPDHALEMVLLAIDIERGLMRVSPENAKYLRLLMGGLCPVEIAEVLGAGFATARSQIFRARKAMRRACGRAV